MSCRKKSFGRFAAIQLESDNCRRGKEYIPIWKKDFNAPGCLESVKEDCCKEVICGNPCDPATPCHDCACKNAAPCVPGCGNLCSTPYVSAPSCHVIKHQADNECKPCKSNLSGRFPFFELNSGACCQPVHEHNPCGSFQPCHDTKKVVFKKIRTDCRGLQPCEREAVGRFPFFKVHSDGACGKSDRDYYCFN